MIKDMLDGKTYTPFPMLDNHPDYQDEYDGYPHIYPKVYSSECSGRYFLEEEMNLSERTWFRLEIGNSELFVTGFGIIGKTEEVIELYIRSVKETPSPVDEDGNIDPGVVCFDDYTPEFTTSVLCSTLIADDELRLN